MPFIVKASQKKTKWPLAPEGVHQAVLIEVKDMGMVETNFGPKHRARFVWELDHAGLKCRVFQVFNVSFDPKSHMRKNVSAVLGRDPGEKFDLDTLVGSVAPLVIGHDEGNDGVTYANVRAILPVRAIPPPSVAPAVEGGAQ